MARARLLWSLESLRFNGGGRPPLWLGLGARTGSSSTGSLRGNSNTLLRDIQDSSSDGSGGKSGRSQVNEAVQDWESQAESEEANTAEEENEEEKDEAFNRGAEPPTAAESEEDATQSQEIAQQQAAEDAPSFVSPLEQELEAIDVAPPAHYANTIAAAPTVVSDTSAIGSSYMMETRTSTTTGAAREPRSVRSSCQVMTYVGEHDNPLPEVKHWHHLVGRATLEWCTLHLFFSINLNANIWGTTQCIYGA